MNLLEIKYVIYEPPNTLIPFINVEGVIDFLHDLSVDNNILRDIYVGLELTLSALEYLPKPFPFTLIHLIAAFKRGDVYINRFPILECLKIN